MGIKFANSAFATLASGINNSATSITLTTGQGARFPSLSAGDYFFATLIDTSNNLEIVKCTARSTDVLTVTRAQESTTARAFSTGDRIELRITAQGLVDASGDLASGTLAIPGTSASGAIARLYEDTDNGTNYIGLKAPASVASNLDFTLPSTDGTNGQFLKTNGSGVLSFDTVAQKVLQLGICVETRQTYYNPGSMAWVLLTGLQITLTAQSNSSIILLDTVLHHSGAATSYNWVGRFRYSYTVNSGAAQIITSPQTTAPNSAVAMSEVATGSSTYVGQIAGGHYIPSSAYNAGDVVVVTVSAIGTHPSYYDFYINRPTDTSNSAYSTNTTSYIRAWEVESAVTSLNT
jgi:hypothetical protein